MINTYFNELAEYLKTELPWLDCVGSNVSYFKGQEGDLPVSCFDENCKKTSYLVPSSSKSSILFFEFRGKTKNVIQPCVTQNDFDFDIFFWFNCEKIEVKVDSVDIECCEKIDYLYNEIKDKLKGKNAIVNGVTYQVSKPFLTDKTMFYPYQNFQISVSVKVIGSDCNKQEIANKQNRMLELLITSFLIGTTGYVFTHILIQYGGVLHFYSKLLDKIENEHIKKPLGDCALCFTGQLALWIGLLYFKFDLVELILLISASIFMIKTIEDKWS